MRRQAPRAGQGWIFDNFLKLSDNEEVLHAGMMGVRLERGFKYADMERVFQRVSGRRSFPRSWAREAAKQEILADEANAAGRRVTAGQHFHRAALYYGRAQHLIPVDGHPRKIEYHGAAMRCYAGLMESLDGAVTRHEIEIENGQKIAVLFHHAPGDGPKPTVLHAPGMDQIKEDFPNPYNNEFTRRGMNICVMDGPGQGESNLNHVWQTIGNYGRAGSRAIDWLVERGDVDADRIAVFGTSMGTRYGVEIGADDDRVKAVIGKMANVGPSDVIYDQAQPNFKTISMYMAGMTDEDEFDRFTEERDAYFFAAGDRLTCPYLLVAGDMDELCPPDDVQVWMDRLTCPKELWLYEDVFHPMGEVAADVYPAIADWIAEVLENGLPAGHDVRRDLKP